MAEILIPMRRKQRYKNQRKLVFRENFKDLDYIFTTYRDGGEKYGNTPLTATKKISKILIFWYITIVGTV